MQAAITSLQNVPNPERRQLGGFRTKVFRGTTLLATADHSHTGPVTFSITAVPGSYTATAQRLDNFGTPFGPEAVSPPLEVGGPETFDAPATLTLTL